MQPRLAIDQVIYMTMPYRASYNIPGAARRDESKERDCSLAESHTSSMPGKFLNTIEAAATMLRYDSYIAFAEYKATLSLWPSVQPGSYVASTIGLPAGLTKMR